MKRIMKIPHRLVAFLSFVSLNVSAFKTYQQLIPNGDSVPDPCNANNYWLAVGHMTANGGTDRNPFGLDFQNIGKVWNEELCQMDSDGDGRSNGEELGDPDCLWRKGVVSVGMGTALSHPGICEPLDSSFCKKKNSWLSCENKQFDCDAIKEKETRNFTIRFPEMDVPSDSTTYVCMIVDAPTDQDYHIVASSPVIESPGLIHHILLYGCIEDGPYGPLEQSNNKPFMCGMGATMQCMTDLLSVWVVGSEGECMHPDAGFKIGPNGYKKLAIQVHWTNPEQKNTLRDSSGMTVYITPKLRQYDAGILWTGQSYMEIPASRNSYSVNGTCTKECTKAMLGEDIKLIGALSHMHLLGKEQSVQQYRDGQLLRTVFETRDYHYNHPEPQRFPQPITVKAGDELRTACTYDSSKKRSITLGGDSTTDEMCIAFIKFYPKSTVAMPICMNFKELSICESAPQYKEAFPNRLEGCDVMEFANLGNPVIIEMVFKVQAKCKPYFCLAECKDAMREIRKHPCLKGDVWEYLKFTLFTMKTAHFASEQMEKLMAAYTSCDLELGIENGVIQGENSMMKYMLENQTPPVDCTKCGLNSTTHGVQTPQSKPSSDRCIPNSAVNVNQSFSFLALSLVTLIGILIM